MNLVSGADRRCPFVKRADGADSSLEGSGVFCDLGRISLRRRLIKSFDLQELGLAEVGNSSLPARSPGGRARLRGLVPVGASVRAASLPGAEDETYRLIKTPQTP